MAQVNEKDVVAIRDWLAKEPYLPKDCDDLFIKKFLFSCQNSLEKTKRCLEEFCTSRATMTELYTDRDPASPRMKTVFSNTWVTCYHADDDEILIHRLLTTEQFEFYDILKSIMIQGDYWIRQKQDVLPLNHVIILDIKEYTLMLVAKSNIFYFQKFLTYLLLAMPVRLKKIHVVNCPSFYEYLYNLVKAVLPQEVRDIITFHTDHTGLHQFTDKKYLPLEYGGEAESMLEQNARRINEIIAERKIYSNENLWKANLNKKPKNGTVEKNMSGSFRTLAID